MGFELGAVVVGGISILTIIVTKLKCYAKKNGSCNYGIGFTEKPLIEEEYEVKTLDLNGVSVMYTIAKHHVPHHEEETEDVEED
jgi:hypothetical protein